MKTVPNNVFSKCIKPMKINDCKIFDKKPKCSWLATYLLGNTRCFCTQNLTNNIN